MPIHSIFGTFACAFLSPWNHYWKLEMKTCSRTWLVCLLLLGCSLFSGCAMCCGTYDEAYAGSGGTWQRSDLFHGRVGSLFSDPNARNSGGEYIEDLGEMQLEEIN